MPRKKRYSDQPLDTSSRHSIKIVTPAPSEVVAGAESGELQSITVDHFYHEGDYWRAEIPIGAVESIRGQAFNFSKPKTRNGENGPEVVFNKRGIPMPTISIINHVQTRFRLKPGYSVRLFPMADETGAAPTDESVHEIDDFIYSVEAVGPPGTTFNFSDAMSGALICAHRFSSTQEMVFERLAVEGMYVTESAPLPLAEDEKRMALSLSLLRSDQAGMKEPYYLYRFCGTNNCTSNAFSILDRVVNYGWLRWFCSLIYRLPLRPRMYLRMRGLDADPSFFKLLRTEFEEFIQDRSTQARKRTYVREKIRERRSARGETKQGSRAKRGD